MRREDLLVETLVQLADTLVDDYDLVDTLTLLVDRCVEMLDISAAGLMLVGPEGRLRLAASSSDAMRIVELFELQSEEGPCLDCYRYGESVTSADLLRVNGRWPLFRPVAVEAGFRSVHALPMRLRSTILGAMNLFSTEPHELSPDDVVAGKALADMASIAILQNRAALEAQLVNENLSRALNDRLVIEQAKGVLAERTGCDLEQAFSILRNHARNHNLRLVEVARSVIDGTLSESSLDVPRSS
jgi:GAF domain-containing protein